MSQSNRPDVSEIPRPRLLISRCVGFDHCRWNGDMISSPYVEKLKKHIEFVTVCPESDIGLGIPRKPVRLVLVNKETKMIQPDTGLDATEKMTSFAETFLGQLHPVEGFVYKERSPSCGMSNVRVHLSAKEGSPVDHIGSGLFANSWKNAYPSIPCASEGHLFNYGLREHFYTQVYTLARFRAIQKNPLIKSLVDFHARHKFILMAYHQTHMRQMGRLVANHEHLDAGKVFNEYFSLLCLALEKPPRVTSPINVLMHALGYFSEKVTAGEKKYFLDILEQFRAKKIPLSSCNAVIKSWIVRFDEKYLAAQYFFAPYPDAIIELSDSGK